MAKSLAIRYYGKPNELLVRLDLPGIDAEIRIRVQAVYLGKSPAGKWRCVKEREEGNKGWSVTISLIPAGSPGETV